MIPNPETAADAFNALRTEVAVGFRRIEPIIQRLSQIGPIDITEHFDGLTHQILTIRRVVEEIAESPALQPQFELRSHDGALPPEARRIIDALSAQLHSGRTAGEQGKWLKFAAIGGFVIGATAWATFAGPIAGIAPARWHWPERMAARTLRLDIPEAGLRMIRASDPATSRDILTGITIVGNNRDELERCFARARRDGKRRTCALMVDGRNQ